MSRIILSLRRGAQVSAIGLPNKSSQTVQNIHSMYAKQHMSFLTRNNFYDRHNRSSILTAGNQIRNIYSPFELKIEAFKKARQLDRDAFESTSFIDRIKSCIEDPEKHAILTHEDLRVMVHLCDTEADIDLLENLIVIVNNRLPLNRWGARVMRLYFEMRQTDRAYNNLKDVDGKFKGFFTNSVCYKIAMTMLYNDCRYNDVLDLFENAEKELKDDPIFRKVLAPIVFATYYNLNTAEALQSALKLRFEGQYEDYDAQVNFFIVGLAFKTGQPASALDVLSNCGPSQWIVREMKLQALLKLKRFEDSLSYLRQQELKIHRETLELVRTSLEEIEDQVLCQDFNDALLDLEKSERLYDDSKSMYDFAQRLYTRQKLNFDLKKPPQGKVYRENNQGWLRDNNQGHYRNSDPGRFRDNNQSGHRNNYQRNNGNRSEQKFEDTDNFINYEENVNFDNQHLQTDKKSRQFGRGRKA